MRYKLRYKIWEELTMSHTGGKHFLGRENTWTKIQRWVRQVSFSALALYGEKNVPWEYETLELGFQVRTLGRKTGSGETFPQLGPPEINTERALGGRGYFF